MQARMCIEPAIAREAAINASGEAITRIKIAKEKAAAAPNWADYETHDDLFHRAIAEAADNILLLALFDQLNAVRRAVFWGRSRSQSDHPPNNHHSFQQHEDIVHAISQRNADDAYNSMYEHLLTVRDKFHQARRGSYRNGHAGE